MHLELAVSSALTRLRALERALHDRGPWEMELATGDRVPANRFVLDDRVQFCAQFPSTNGLDDAFVTLLCDGWPVAVRRVETPLSGSFILDWTLTVTPAISV